MPQLTPYYLNFHSGMHVGAPTGKLEESAVQIPADTLFASFVHVWRRCGLDPTLLVAGFVDQPADPPFLLTSAFPFAGGVRFYPMPVDLTCLFTSETLKDRGKEFKRIRHFSEALLRRMVDGERLDDWLFPAKEHDEPDTGVALQGGALWLTVQEASSLPADMLLVEPDANRVRPLHALRQQAIYATDRVPRVTVNRIDSASTIYHAGLTTFAAGCGLWFGVQMRTPNASVGETGKTWQATLELALTMLGDEGIGGERSSGYGGFRFASGDPFPLPDVQPRRPAFLLSRYHPTSGELPTALTDPAAAYGLTSVAGWLQSPDAVAQRRKRLMLVQEGSIVCPPQAMAGDVVDVRPEYGTGTGVSHPVYRYGLALGVDASKLKEGRHG